MKKSNLIFIALFLSIILIACGSNGSKSKVNSTKEFSYLPAYEGMELKEFNEPKDDMMGEAKYTLKDSKAEDVLSNYEKLLTKNSWKVVEDNKPTLITVEKDDHKAIIISNQLDKDVEITIVSK